MSAAFSFAAAGAQTFASIVRCTAELYMSEMPDSVALTSPFPIFPLPPELFVVTIWLTMYVVVATGYSPLRCSAQIGPLLQSKQPQQGVQYSPNQGKLTPYEQLIRPPI